MKHRPLLMSPGPIEVEPAVLKALGAPTDSHVSSEFIDVFARVLKGVRKIWKSPSGQPFVVAGSGTMAMDMAAANLIEPEDKVLILSTGYFGERFSVLSKRYGADVTVLRASLGDIVTADQVSREMGVKKYKLMVFTHVDTSTAVRMDPGPLGKLGRKHGVLTVLDGVCSVGGEKLCQEDWGIDVVLTASQKAIGVPPGLALLVASQGAMKTWRLRQSPVTNYYADWNNWLPIMEAYEHRHPSYFGTPPVNLICALDVSIQKILKEGLEKRIARHQRLGAACREAIFALKMQMVPKSPGYSAATMTAPFYPEGVSGSDFLKKVRAAGVTLAGGLHPEIKDRYFRIGHMGSTKAGELLKTVGAIEKGLMECGYEFDPDIGVAAARKILREGNIGC